MKKLIFFVLLFIGFTTSINYANAVVSVKGYYRANGTYVAPHYRSDPDGIKSNNWSYPGNTNPYTGKTAGGSVDSYLNNSSSYKSTYTAPSYSSYTSPSSYEKVTGGYKSYGVLFCDVNYYESGSKCLKTPKNSTSYGGTNFYCNYGYEKSGKTCVSTKEILKEKQKKASAKINLCENKGNIWYDGSCFEKPMLCKSVFGMHSTYTSGSKVADIKCSCEVGYAFSTIGEKSCVKQ